MLDQDSRFISVYSPASSLYLPPDEFIGKRHADVMSPEIDELFRKALLKLKNGKSAKYTYSLNVSDEISWYEIKLSPMMEGNRYTGAVAVTRDITERVQNEEKANHIRKKLEESEDRLSKVMLAANDGTWDWDLLTNEVYFDPRYYEMAGYKADEFSHRLEEFQKRIHPDDVDYVMKEAQKHLGGESERFIVEFRFKKKNNSWLWVMGRGIVVERDQQGVPLRFVGTHTDITERKKADQALQKSETKFRLLADYTLDWEYWIDQNGAYLYISPACERITGYRPEEFIKNPEFLFEIVKPEYKEEIRKHYTRENRKEKQPYSIQFPILTKDGKERWLEHRCIAFFDEQGNYAGRRGNNRDITDRKNNELALKESEEKFRALFEQAGDYCMILDPNTPDGIPVIIDANEAAYKKHGYTSEEFIGRPVADIDDEEGKKLVLKHTQMIMSGKPFYIENMHLRKDGTTFPVAVHANRIDIEGEPPLIFTTEYDISERIQAEEEITLQAHALEAAANAIMITDDEGNILWVNSAFSALTGYSFGEVSGKNPRFLKSDAHDDTFYQKMWDTILAGEIWRGEVSNKRKNGTLYAEEMTIAPLILENGLIKNFVAIKQDVTERKEAEEVTKQYVERLHALRKIDEVISNSLDLEVTLHILLDYLLVQLNVDAATVLLYEKALQELTFSQAQGFHTAALKKTVLRLGDGYAGKVAFEKEDLYIPDLQKVESSLSKAPLLAEEAFVAYYGVPLIAKGTLVGVLEIFNRSSLDPNDEWISYLHTLAGQAAIAIDNISLFNDLQRSNTNLLQAYNATIEGWAQALELRDMETEGHSRRVVETTMALARRQGFKGQELVNIQRGALLHDIGKMGIPDAILQKTGKLSSEEWEIMKRHPIYAFEWLSSIEYLRPALDIPHYHHERWDGTGYPHGLKAEQIPIAARIFAVVDVWDALLSDRPYRKAWSKEKALAYIQEESGKHFDPEIAALFLEFISEE